MNKLINKILIITALLVSLFAPMTLANSVLAAGKDDICKGVQLTGGNCDTSSGPSVDSTIKLVIDILSMVVGVIAVIMIIIGGLKYIMSSGDSNNITSAKNTILYAIIGLVIVAVAQILVIFVLNKVG